MTNKPFVMKRRFVFWLIGVMSVALGGGHAQTADLSVTDERPVAKAIEELEHRYQVPITYEDTLYFSANDIADVTETVRLDHGVGDNVPRVFVPVRRTITFALPQTSAENASGLSAASLAAVKSLIESYALAVGSDIFTVSQDSSGLHVVARTFIDAAGRPQGLKPSLDEEVSVSSRAVSALEVLEEICRQISVPGGRVVDLGIVPANLVANNEVKIAKRNQKARSVLESVSKQLSVHLSWQLFCDPADDGCALNIHVVE